MKRKGATCTMVQRIYIQIGGHQWRYAIPDFVNEDAISAFANELLRDRLEDHLQSYYYGADIDISIRSHCKICVEADTYKDMASVARNVDKFIKLHWREVLADAMKEAAKVRAYTVRTGTLYVRGDTWMVVDDNDDVVATHRQSHYDMAHDACAEFEDIREATKADYEVAHYLHVLHGDVVDPEEVLTGIAYKHAVILGWLDTQYEENEKENDDDA